MTDPMVTAAWLAEHLDDPNLRIFDASWFMPGSPRDAGEDYARGHIPGAVRFDIDAVSDHGSRLPHMLSSPPDFAVAMRRLGVDPASVVVVYDSQGVFSAPRAWWNLRAMGHEAVFVLDGGLPAWIDAGGPLEAGWRDPTHGHFKAHAVQDLVRDLDAVKLALESGAEQVIDARPAGRFRGEVPEPRPGLRAGHMPGAFNVPFSQVLDGRRLLPRDKLEQAFSDAGIDLANPIIVSCGSGVSACVLALALARLGKSDAAVYDGSWSEWGARYDTSVSVET